MTAALRALLTLTLTALLALQISLATPALTATLPDSAPPCHTDASQTSPDKKTPVVSAHMICCSMAMIAAAPAVVARPYGYVTHLRPHRDNRPVSYAPYEALRPPNEMI
ncbi:MAG: hypothetical protein AAGC58_11770 [Asticcacaulis sp.]